MHLNEHRIIASDKRYSVLDEPTLATFADGSQTEIHEVQCDSTDAVYLAALLVDDHQHWVVFDVRTIARELSHELKAAADRDRPGLVAWALRQRCASVDELRARAITQARHIWEAPDDTTPQMRLDIWPSFVARVHGHGAEVSA